MRPKLKTSRQLETILSLNLVETACSEDEENRQYVYTSNNTSSPLCSIQIIVGNGKSIMPGRIMLIVVKLSAQSINTVSRYVIKQA